MWDLTWPWGFLSLIRSMWALRHMDSRGDTPYLAIHQGKKNIRSQLRRMTTHNPAQHMSSFECKHKQLPWKLQLGIRGRVDGCRKWVSVQLGEVVYQAVRSIGEELELQRGGGISILGGAEELGGGGGCGPTNRTTQLLIIHLTWNWQEMFTIWFSLPWPWEVCICTRDLLWGVGGSCFCLRCSWWVLLWRTPGGRGDCDPGHWGGKTAQAGCGWSDWARCSPAGKRKLNGKL